ncbi:MAG TPA: hypothetical protein VM889_11625 [Candidatus Thermoplasmatota archaeon]|nr:hypothetical protein [Candidatus Thermoplasmatota archaeon]
MPPTYTGQTTIALSAAFLDEPEHCGIQGGYMLDNGQFFPTQKWQDGNNYGISGSRQFSAGHHTIHVRLAENGGAVGELTHHFFVRLCGTGMLAPSSMTPTSAAHGVPTIRVVFRDPDAACGIGAHRLLLDGIEVPAKATTVGKDYVLTYTPPDPLPDGVHFVEAWVEEICCTTNTVEDRNSGSTSWSFEVKTCGGAPLVLDTWGPRESTSRRQPTIHAAFHDRETPCGVAAATMRIDDVVVPATVTIEDHVYRVSYIPIEPLAPGPHRVSVRVTETCCAPANVPNEAVHAWTFTVSPSGPEGERSLGRTTLNVTTPERVEDQGCHAGVCIEEWVVPVRLAARAEVGPAWVHYNLDPDDRTPIGPLSIPGTPISVCNQGVCDVPIPQLTVWTLFRGRVEVDGSPIHDTGDLTLP